MAILKVVVEGGAGFAGYVSVNGCKEIMVVNGGAYEIPTGIVHIAYHTRSSAERKTGRLNAAVNGGSMIGAAMSASSIGESFEINEEVAENTVVLLTAYVRGNRDVYATPVLSKYEATAEEMELEIEDFNSRLSTAQSERKAKTKKMMIIYLILLGIFALAALIFQFIQG